MPPTPVVLRAWKLTAGLKCSQPNVVQEVKFEGLGCGGSL